MRINYSKGTYLSYRSNGGPAVRGAALVTTDSHSQTLVLHRLSRTVQADGSIRAQVKVRGRTLTGRVRLDIPAQGRPILRFHPSSAFK